MRILITAVLVAAGIVVGAAVPAISAFVRGLLTSAGLPPARPLAGRRRRTRPTMPKATATTTARPPRRRPREPKLTASTSIPRRRARKATSR